MAKGRAAMKFVFLPLVFAAVVYFGYLVTETYFYSTTQGSLIFTTDQGKLQKVSLTRCESFWDGNALMVSDDSGNGVVIYPSTYTSVHPIFNGQQLSGYTCGPLASTLTHQELHVRSSYLGMGSWTGSVEAFCHAERSDLHVKVEVHACQ